MKEQTSRSVVLMLLAFTIASYGNHGTWAGPAANTAVVTALTDSYLVSEDGGAADDDGKGEHEAEDGHPEADDEDDGDDANDGEYECVAPQGALLGPVCVRVGGVGEDVLIT